MIFRHSSIPFNRNLLSRCSTNDYVLSGPRFHEFLNSHFGTIEGGNAGATVGPIVVNPVDVEWWKHLFQGTIRPQTARLLRSTFSKSDVNANRELRRSQIFTSQQGAFFSSRLPSNGFNSSRRTPTLSRLVASVGHIFLSNGKSLVSSSLSSMRWMLSSAKYA